MVSLALTMSRAEKLARATQKREAVLGFLASGETYSTLEILAELLQTSERNTRRLLQRLTAEKFLKVENNALPYSPLKLYGVTAHGIAMTLTAHPSAREFYIGKTNPSFIAHHIEGQKIRLTAERAGWTNYLTGKLLYVENAGRLKKLPDALATRPDGRRCSFEIERFIKSKKRMGEAMGGHLAQIVKNNYDLVYYFTPHVAMLERAIKNVESVLVDGSKVQLTDSHRARFKLFDIKNWKGES